jgi:hypothetical protein
MLYGIIFEDARTKYQPLCFRQIQLSNKRSFASMKVANHKVFFIPYPALLTREKKPNVSDEMATSCNPLLVL